MKILTVNTVPVVAIHKKGNFEVLLIQIIKQFIRQLTRSIIKGDGVRIRACAAVEDLTRMVQRGGCGPADLVGE